MTTATQDLHQHVPAEIEPAEWQPLEEIPDVFILSEKRYPSYSVAFNGDWLMVVHFDRPPGRIEKIDAAIATPMTPVIQNWLMSQLPAWWDWNFAARVLIPEQHPIIGDGRKGRFIIPAIMGRPSALLTEREALNIVRNRQNPNEIKFTPGAELVFGHHAFTLWSDGVALSTSLNPAYRNQDKDNDLTPQAKELLTVALGREYWRTDGRWRPLMMVSSVQRQTLDEKKVGGRNSFAEKSLRQLTTDNGLTLYMTVEMSGYLGPEDGDGEEYRFLWDDLAAASKYYKSVKLH